MIVWRRMKPHSVSSSGPDFSRIASGMAILPTSCSSAAWATSSSSSPCIPSSRPTASARSAVPRRCTCRSGWRSDRLRSSTSRDWRPAETRRSPLRAYMRRSASCSASVAWSTSIGASTTPCEVVTSKPSPCSASAATQASTSTSSAGRARVQHDAELVAAEPVGAPVAVHGVGEPLAQPHQQAVAGRVAEGVVVLLEAVEVEQHQRERSARAVASAAASSRSAIRLRRLRSPVSGSVSASRRLWASTRWFSANTSAVRTSTSSSVTPASATVSPLRLEKWS